MLTRGIFWIMQSAAETYGSVAKTSVSPRELEASLLIKAAAKLQTVKEDGADTRSALNEALNYNQRLWTVFASAVTDPESPLPHAVRENVASLSAFIFAQTMEAMTAPAPHKLSVLININRQIAAGLRGIESEAPSAV